MGKIVCAARLETRLKSRAILRAMAIVDKSPRRFRNGLLFILYFPSHKLRAPVAPYVAVWVHDIIRTSKYYMCSQQCVHRTRNNII